MQMSDQLRIASRCTCRKRRIPARTKAGAVPIYYRKTIPQFFVFIEDLERKGIDTSGKQLIVHV